MALEENANKDKKNPKIKIGNESGTLETNPSAIIDKLEREIADLTKERKIDLVRNNVVDKACIVSMTDKKGYITYVNDLFCEISGYTREECIGQNQNMVRHPNMPKEAFKDLWATIGRGEVWRGEVENRCKDGSSYHVDALISPILGDNGKPEAYIGIRYEKTEQILAMREAEALQSAVDAGWASIEFDPSGTVLKANDNFVGSMNYNSSHEIVGKHHRQFVERAHANSSEYIDFWKALGEGIIQSGDFLRIKKNGEEIWLKASYTPVKNAQGVVTKVIKIATDITSQKLAEIEGQNVILELNRVIEIVNHKGDLSERLKMDNLSVDNEKVVSGVNGLLNTVSEPILNFKSLMNEMASGNLQEEFTMEVNGDLKSLGDSYNEAIQSISSLLSEISQVANLVASSSEELLTKSDQMQGTTQEVASAIQQMAEGAHQQAQQTDDTSKLVEEVLKSSNAMGDKADLINKAAESGQKSSSEGLKTVRKVVENMGEIQDAASVTSKSIDVLSERSEEIARTLNVITDIAAQTNLLALNAAIEAARAGEAGRGFAVVAEEIRKLAEDSRKSAIDIQKVITAVQKDINQAGKAIDTMSASVKSGNQASRDAEIVFGSIESLTAETFSLSKEIQAATEGQRVSITDTVKNIEKIVVVAEETAAGSEQIATSSKDLSLGMEEVNSTSKQLATAANQLQAGVSKFTLR